MATDMQYKTMVLELLQERSQIHELLRMERKVLATVESQARELKARHEELIEVFSQMKPWSESSQISGMALEMALQELEEGLAGDSLPETSEHLSLDAAMAYLHRHSSHV